MNREQLIERMKRLQGERPASLFAQELGVSTAYLSEIYRGKAEPGPKILEALKLEREIFYRPIATETTAA